MRKEKFTVICDARFGSKLGIKTLAMIDKKKSDSPHWWTGTDSDDIIRYNRLEAAQKTAASLKNNARAVSVAEAEQILENQRKSIDESRKDS